MERVFELADVALKPGFGCRALGMTRISGNVTKQLTSMRMYAIIGINKMEV
jgi:hypothetical protein